MPTKTTLGEPECSLTGECKMSELMTYADLLQKLLFEATPEELAQSVTIFNEDSGEYFGIRRLARTDDSVDVVDPGQIILA